MLVCFFEIIPGMCVLASGFQLAVKSWAQQDSSTRALLEGLLILRGSPQALIVVSIWEDMLYAHWVELIDIALLHIFTNTSPLGRVGL